MHKSQTSGDRACEGYILYNMHIEKMQYTINYIICIMHIQRVRREWVLVYIIRKVNVNGIQSFS